MLNDCKRIFAWFSKEGRRKAVRYGSRKTSAVGESDANKRGRKRERGAERAVGGSVSEWETERKTREQWRGRLSEKCSYDGQNHLFLAKASAIGSPACREEQRLPHSRFQFGNIFLYSTRK